MVVVSDTVHNVIYYYTFYIKQFEIPYDSYLFIATVHSCAYYKLLFKQCHILLGVWF